MNNHIRSIIMPVAMIGGALSYRHIAPAAAMTPYLIFFMLLIPYCKIEIQQMKLSSLHLILLAIQMIGSLGSWALIRPFNEPLAQGCFIAFFAPTATAAVAVTAILKGNISTLTSYTLLINLLIALIGPFLFSIITLNNEITFWSSFQAIIIKVSPLILIPLALAFLLKITLPNVHSFLGSNQQISFYLWVFALFIVSAKATDFIMMQPEENYKLGILIALASLTICIFQFWIGKKIGKRYNNTIAAGQALGQKNTILAIWISFTFLSPIASIAPVSYILWQNMINSWQIYKASE